MLWGRGVARVGLLPTTEVPSCSNMLVYIRQTKHCNQTTYLGMHKPGPANTMWGFAITKIPTAKFSFVTRTNFASDNSKKPGTVDQGKKKQTIHRTYWTLNYHQTFFPECPQQSTWYFQNFLISKTSLENTLLGDLFKGKSKLNTYGGIHA